MLKISKILISLIFAIFVKLRNFLYNHSILKGKYFNDITTISVGNLNVGGTGKTPHIEYLIRLLKNKYQIATLSRGYKRKTKGYLIADATTTHKDIGDEAVQIHKKFKNDITVSVCEQRVQGIKNLRKNAPNINLILLDDSFQHRKLIPQISILLTNHDNPFFLDKFFPAGNLRDNKLEYRRANIIIVTNCPPDIKPIQKSIWRDNIKLLPYQEIFFTTIKYTKIKKVTDFKTTIDKETLKNHHIIILTGIANQKYFISHVKKTITTKTTILKFKDHKKYNKKNIERIKKIFDTTKAKKKIILTTEKDAVKLAPLVPKEIKSYFYYQEIEIDFLFNLSEKFKNKIESSINSKI